MNSTSKETRQSLLNALAFYFFPEAKNSFYFLPCETLYEILDASRGKEAEGLVFPLEIRHPVNGVFTLTNRIQLQLLLEDIKDFCRFRGAERSTGNSPDPRRLY